MVLVVQNQTNFTNGNDSTFPHATESRKTRYGVEGKVISNIECALFLACGGSEVNIVGRTGAVEMELNQSAPIES